MRRERKSRDRAPAALASILEDELGAFSGPPPVPLKLVRGWDEAVGERVARRTRPTRLLGSTLLVRVVSSSWMAELQMLTPVILEKLQKRSGFKGITQLRFELGALDRWAPNARPTSPEAPQGRWATRPLPSPIAQALDALDDRLLRETIEATLRRTLSSDGEPER